MPPVCLVLGSACKQGRGLLMTAWVRSVHAGLVFGMVWGGCQC